MPRCTWHIIYAQLTWRLNRYSGAWPQVAVFRGHIMPIRHLPNPEHPHLQLLAHVPSLLFIPGPCSLLPARSSCCWDLSGTPVLSISLLYQVDLSTMVLLPPELNLLPARSSPHNMPPFSFLLATVKLLLRLVCSHGSLSSHSPLILFKAGGDTQICQEAALDVSRDMYLDKCNDLFSPLLISHLTSAF